MRADRTLGIKQYVVNPHEGPWARRTTTKEIPVKTMPARTKFALGLALLDVVLLVHVLGQLASL